MNRRRPARLQLADSTLREGNRLALGGALGPEEIVELARNLDSLGFRTLDAFGSGTFETIAASGTDPWEHLRKLASAVKKTPLQASLSGHGLVSHRPLPKDVIELFIEHAAAAGVAVFRFHDALNDLRNLEVAVAAAKSAGKRVEGALAYAASPVHTPESWALLARQLVEMGCEAVVITDSAGLLTPGAARTLVAELKQAVDVPVALHAHCGTGLAPMAYLAAAEAGADALDTAISAVAGGTSLPSAESVAAALAGTDQDTGLDLGRLADANSAIAEIAREPLQQRADRAPEAELLRRQVSSGMVNQAQEQLRRHQAEPKLQDVLAEMPRIREELGYPPLAAPFSGMIASQAVLNVVGGDRYATVTQDLKDYLQGLHGRPPGKASADLRRLVLGREEPITMRASDLLEPLLERARADLRRGGGKPDDGQVLLHVLMPAVASELFGKDGRRRRKEPAPADEDEAVESEDAAQAAVEDGAAPAQQATDQPAPQQGPAEFQVEVEGEVFTVRVSGMGVAAGPVPQAAPAKEPAVAPAKPSGAAVVAPMQGLIVKLRVGKGDRVNLGDPVAVLEAMKMQNDIASTAAGEVTEVHVKEGDVVGANQPILSIG